MTALWRSRSERCVDTPDPLRREKKSVVARVRFAPCNRP
jgi:hypothetical protein